VGQIHFVIPNRAESPVRSLLFAGNQQVLRAIKPRFGMTALSN